MSDTPADAPVLAVMARVCLRRREDALMPGATSGSK
jgi:hypothetical protein